MTQTPPHPEAGLGELLCFAIYSANLAFGRTYKPMLDELGLTYPQYIALVALYEEEGVTVSRLGEKLFLDSNTLTPLLKRLETAGLVDRRRDLRDERQVLVSLTPAGRAAREKAFAFWDRLVASSGVAEDEASRLRQELVQVRDHLLQSGS